MKILITGANGQLGNELRLLAKIYNNIFFVFTDYQELDITNFEDIKTACENENYDFIINCAAYTAVDKAESEIEKANLLNALAVENLVNGCKINNSIFIHISTDYVFDGEKPEPYLENDKTNPMSAYGQTKLDGERYSLEYSKSIVIRTAWLYSAFGNNFVKTMLRLGIEREELNVVADQIGSPTYAADLARAIMQIINSINENPEKAKFGIYQYSNDGSCSWCDFAREIMLLGRRNCKVNAITTAEYPTPARRPKFSLLSKEKIKTDYNVDVPQWQDSLKKCIEILMDDKNQGL